MATPQSRHILKTAAEITAKKLRQRFSAEELATHYDPDAVTFSFNLQAYTGEKIPAADLRILEGMEKEIAILEKMQTIDDGVKDQPKTTRGIGARPTKQSDKKPILRYFPVAFSLMVISIFIITSVRSLLE